MQNFHAYDRTIEAESEESLSKIVNMIPEYSIVLDVGCSTGMLGRYLSEKKGCIVDGVDFDSAAVEIARSKYRFTAVKNLELETITDVFKAEAYDCIVIADVIEHLVNPNRLLSDLKQLIKPNGVVIFSVPNITHIASSLELLLGNFDYRQNGLLDSTHLRFYSYKNLVATLNNAGLYIWKTDAVSKDLCNTEFGVGQSKIFPKNWLDALIANRPDSLVYQWIIAAKIYPRTDEVENHPAVKIITEKPIFTTVLYWEDIVGAGFNENNKVVGIDSSKIENELVVDFIFQILPEQRISKIRIDPISEKKIVWIKSAKISDEKNETLWEWAGKEGCSDLINAKWIDAQVQNGKILSAENDDPQWYPDIPQETLQKITSGSKCSIVVCDDGGVIGEVLINTLSVYRLADHNSLASLNKAVAEHEEKTAGLQVRILELERALFNQTLEVVNLKKSVLDARRELANMMASKSWIITKPLRFLRRISLSMTYRAARSALSNGSRAMWRMLPISYESKRSLKRMLFKTFPFVFRWSNAYQAWNAFNEPVNYKPMINYNDRVVGLTEDEYVHRIKDSPLEKKPAKLICFYLPQFHAIPENNEWWGEGFTEWTNVKPAQPQFKGHYQPHVPDGLGYYNLLEPAVQRQQVDLAKLYGIEGFCFYFYWFGGRRLLEAPIENYLNDKTLDLPFCLCWANENWSRRWDGLDSEILIAQQHSVEDDLAFIQEVARYMQDTRYIRINSKPLLLVYRPSLLPSAKETASRWRDWCRANGVGEIYLAYTQSFETVDPAEYGFDAAIEFPPNNSAPPNITGSITPIVEDFASTVYDWRVFVERSEHYKQQPYTLFRSVCPSWDNTPRRKNRGAVFLNSTPALYQRWLENAIYDTQAHRSETDERLIFVNAWNEWAEGAHLEPDARYGYAWLQATRNALAAREVLVQRLILVVTHDCHPHGAQFLVLEMIRQLVRIGYKPVIVALHGGKLLEDFRALGPLIVGSASSATEMDSFLTTWRNRGCIDALTSTVVCGSLLPTLKGHGYRVISLIHELSGVIKAMKQESNARQIAALADKLVFPANMVREQYEALAPVAPDKVVIRSQGLLRKNPYKGRKPEAHRKVCTRHGLSPDTQIVLNVGYLDERKGPDLFVEIASKVCERNAKVVFIWVGHAETAMEQKVKLLIEQLGLKNKVLLAGFNAEPFEYYASASAYALTSREDPFPNVVLESVAVGVPVVAFESATGAADFIQEHDGLLARHLDPTDFADRLLELLDNPQGSLVDPDFSMQRYLLDLLHALNGMPRVSVVLPNYNYAQLIEKRLASIYAQGYPIYELIILDDASTDDSLKSIEGAISNRPFDARLHVNERNSGSVFRQWEKGVRLASGDLVWIAEADDIADPAFLSTLVPAFRNENMVMAFCQSRQIDSNGHVLANDYLAYTGDISDRWKNDYFADGLQEIQESLAIKNVIPNVSGVVFDRRALLKAMEAVGEKLFEYRVAGDWLVYLHVLAQGQLYYSAKSLNDHRRHQNSVTSAAGLEKHLKEVASLQAVAQSLSKPESRIEAQASDYLARLRTQFNLDSNPAAGDEHEKVNGA